MKKIIVLTAVVIALATTAANAQHVRVRLEFPTTVRVGAPGPPPYSGGVWVGPEWRWRNGRYESVPGYWARPQRHYHVWVQGHWVGGRRGYRWIPGHWA